MSTNTTIDLSKVKIGQRLKRRDGREVVLQENMPSSPSYPIRAGEYYYTYGGHYYRDRQLSEWDIIEIVQPKKAKKPEPNKAVSEAIATLKQAIKKLEGLA